MKTNPILTPIPMPVYPASLFGLVMSADWFSEELIKGDVVLVDPDAPFVDGELYVVEVLDQQMVRRVHKNSRRYQLLFDGGVIEVDCAEVKFLGRVIGRVREH